jgi:transcriptional regulator with XRE-family HTH domain
MATRLGDFLRSRREELKLSIQDIESGMPITANTIGQIERGEIEIPSESVLEGFTRVLQVSISQLRNLLPSDAMPRESVAVNKDFIDGYFEVLELEAPHGFLMAQGKKTAIARTEPLETGKSYLIVSAGEAFGVAKLEEPAQIKTKQFDAEEWQSQHRITQRERRQWWPDSEAFYVYRLKEWKPFEGIKLYEDGEVIDEPRLTPEQWQIVSIAKELPKQITLIDNAVSVTDQKTFIFDRSINPQSVESVLRAGYDLDYIVNEKVIDESIPIYSLALVRNPRMRPTKKSKKQEGEDMPYEIERRDNEFCVIKTEDGESAGCHETREEAEAQLAALRINVEEGESAAHTDKPKKRKPKKKELITNDVDPDTDIDDPEKAKKTGFVEGLRNVAKSIGDFLKAAETEEKEVKLFVNEVGIAQKEVNGELWHFTWSTNAFEDREGEIFSTKGLEDYVVNNESNQDKGYFNLWHINEEDGNFNTDFAKKEWQGVIGRFLVEAGPYLDDTKGKAAKKFFKRYGSGHPEIAPEGWGCSPEYKYLPEERMTGTYNTIWITRTSTLSKFAAANIWTEARQLGGTKMALSDQQKKAAIEMFGDEFVGQMIQEAESKTTELEQAGVAHKAKESEEKTEQPELQQVNINMEELAAEVGKQFTANLDPIAEAMATMATELKELKEWKERQEKEKEVKDLTESPRYVFNMTRASESESSIVTEDDDLKGQKPRETQGKANDPWSQIFK